MINTVTLFLIAFHVFFAFAWFAGLFYLPRLFVYHSKVSDRPGCARFEIMEHRLFFYIMTPSAILTTLLGFIIMYSRFNLFAFAGWMHVKIVCVILVWMFHMYCFLILRGFKRVFSLHGTMFYRVFNEIPTLLLIIILIMIIVRPHFL